MLSQYHSFSINRVTEDFFLKNYEEELIGYYKVFKRNNDFKQVETNWSLILEAYPEERKQLLSKKEKIYQFLTFITESFKEDICLLNSKVLNRSLEDKIINFEIGAGDFHNGKSTTILHLPQQVKLVFKPTDGKITESYHNLLTWLSNYYFLGTFQFKILNRKEYHWLEFLNYFSCQNQNEINSYYKRAGFLLCVTYLLNSSDLHYENVISRGDTPILIDHETITQPKIASKNLTYFKKYGNNRDSVLDSFLLLDNEVQVDLPRGKCGFGYHNQTYTYGVKKNGVNRFKNNWKMVNTFIKDDFFIDNIPTLNNNKVYPNEYLGAILEGFELCYNLLLSKKYFLRDDANSPIKKFENCFIRYIWRPTNVYAKILEQLKHSKHLNGHIYRERKIKKYLSIAYNKVPKGSKIWLIYKHEVAQMLRGDIPYFQVNTSSKDLITEFGPVKDFFELSAVENIKRKLNKLSYEDLDYQKELIVQSVS